jgi:hypothetical protein
MPEFCPRHIGEQTSLRCSRCETLICPKCAILTSVGYRCPDCGKEKSAVGTMPPATLVLGCSIAAGLGFVASRWIPGFGVLSIILGVASGAAIGELVLRATGMKRSRWFAASGLIGLGAGVFLPAILSALGTGNLSASGAAAGVLGDVWGIVFAACAAFVLAARVT